MIRTLVTLTIGAFVGLAFAREQRKVEHLREELLELEIAFDELQFERDNLDAALYSIAGQVARKAVQANDDFPEYLEEK